MKSFECHNKGYYQTRKMKGIGQWNPDIDGERCPFAIITQKIEAYMVLENVGKRITDEVPEAPIFTIHDAVYTIPKYDIKLIILSEFKAVFHQRVSLKVQRADG